MPKQSKNRMRRNRGRRVGWAKSSNPFFQFGDGIISRITGRTIIGFTIAGSATISSPFSLNCSAAARTNSLGLIFNWYRFTRARLIFSANADSVVANAPAFQGLTYISTAGTTGTPPTSVFTMAESANSVVGASSDTVPLILDIGRQSLLEEKYKWLRAGVDTQGVFYIGGSSTASGAYTQYVVLEYECEFCQPCNTGYEEMIARIEALRLNAPSAALSDEDSKSTTSSSVVVKSTSSNTGSLQMPPRGVSEGYFQRR